MNLFKTFTEIDRKIIHSQSLTSRNVTATGKAEVRFEWGGSDGPSMSGSISGNVSDNKGNQAEGKVEVQSDGSGSVSISVSHDETADLENS